MVHQPAGWLRIVDHCLVGTDDSTSARPGEHDHGPPGPVRWVVWRQDDNGNRFEVARFELRAEADALAATMQARGHKQTYWVARAGRT
jgi:hypothetical protein